VGHEARAKGFGLPQMHRQLAPASIVLAKDNRSDSTSETAKFRQSRRLPPLVGKRKGTDYKPSVNVNCTSPPRNFELPRDSMLSTGAAASLSAAERHESNRLGHRGHCRFKFGVDWHHSPSTAPLLAAADYLTAWIGPPSRRVGPRFNRYWHGKMLDHARVHNSTVVFYAYLIAGLARHVGGLRDCDMAETDATSLCVHGAEFIRRSEPAVLELYSHFANETAARLGRTSDTIWLIEPDWYQYSQRSQQSGGLEQNSMVALYGIAVHLSVHLSI